MSWYAIQRGQVKENVAGTVRYDIYKIQVFGPGRLENISEAFYLVVCLVRKFILQLFRFRQFPWGAISPIPSLVLVYIVDIQAYKEKDSEYEARHGSLDSSLEIC